MIRREENPEFINRIVNDDAVRPFVHLRGEQMDFTPIANLRPTQSGIVILSNGEDAIAVFELTASDEFQVHTMFGPTCRGRKAIETGKAMVNWMFARNAKRIWGGTPIENRKARYFNRQVGGRPFYRDDEEELFEITPDSRVS